ncbi:MAG TPA: phage tail tape measure protein [Saprospiraceae bacterium]|nr:phage tail tape measure protein [Saprospiraceae bacterium]
MAGKSLAFDIKINGVGLGQKELDSIEKGAKKAKTAVDDLTKAWKSNENEIENMARKQAQVASAERRFNKAAKDELKAENEIRKTNSAIRKKQVQDAIEADSKQKRSIEGLRLIVRDLRKEYNKLSEAQLNNRGGKAMLKQLQQEEALLQKRERAYGLAARNVGNYPQAAGQIASNLTGGLVGGGVVGGAVAGAAAAAALVTSVIRLNSEIDGLQADVRKTTGLNAEAVERLTDRLRALDTSTTLQELLDISKIAGRFGVEGEKSVGDFTEAVNLLNIALGDNFAGGAEEITTQVSKLSNVLYGATSNGTELADNFLHLGNVINVLDNKTNATADEIVDASIRFGSLAKSLGLSASETIGLSTGFLDLGINVERGSGAMIRFNSVIRTKLKEVSEQIGVSQEDFKNLLNTKPVDAMILVITKLKERFGSDQVGLIGALKQMGLGSANVQELVLAMSNNLDRFNDIVNTSNAYIGSTNSLLAEQANQMDSLPDAWNRLKNALADLAVDSDFQEWMKSNVNSVTEFIEVINGGGGLAYTIDKLAGKTFEGTLLGDYYENRANELVKLIKRRKAAAKEVVERLTKDDVINPLFDSKNFSKDTSFGITNNTKVLTPEEKAAIKKKLEEIAKETERLRKEAEAKGAFGSISYITKDISDLKQLMDKTYDSKLLSGYALQLDELNKKLEEAQLRTRVITSKAINKKNGNDDLLGILPSRININQVDQLNPTQNPLKGIEGDGGLGRRSEEAQKLQAQQDEAKDIYIQSAQDTTNQLLDIWQTYNQKKLDQDLKSLQTEYDAKLEAVKGNTTLELALQKEFDVKREALEKKAAREAQRLAIIQANINGALAVIASFKTGFNPVSVAQAIAAGVATATQIAIIKSQKFAKGGFTGTGTGQRDETGHIPVGTVHDGEWVGNKKFVTENPSLFNYLERVQANKYRPFASGGFTSPQLPIPQVFNSIDQANSVNGGSRFSRQELMELKAVLFEGTYQGTYLGGDEKHRQAERNNLAVKNSQR